MYKLKNGLFFTIVVVISVAGIFFMVARNLIESNDINKKVNKHNAIENVEYANRQWNGHRWIASHSVPNESLDREISVTKIANQHLESTNNVSELVEAIMVNVLIEEENKIATLLLEDYVLAVTLKEMPWQFKNEAIKAQMIAARTYIMYKLNHPSQVGLAYDVTNTTAHQVLEIIDEDKMNEQQKVRYIELKQLLETTSGKVITYNGSIIDALYFSTSNGKTEAGKDYFGGNYPYLQSVTSKWDINISPSYEKQNEFSYNEFENKLYRAGLIEKVENKIDIKVVNRTTSKRIKELKVNGHIITAKQFREVLDLASTDFSWELNKQKKQIIFFTRGYGHGVGMSQWGAEGMAREGYTAEQILKYYYSNIEVESL